MTDEELVTINNSIAKIWLDAGDTLKTLLEPLSDQEIIEVANHWENKIKSEDSTTTDDACDAAWVAWSAWSEEAQERRLQLSVRDGFEAGFEAGVKSGSKDELPGGYWNFLNKIKFSLYVKILFRDADEYMKAHPDAKMYCPFHQRHDCWNLHDE